MIKSIFLLPIMFILSACGGDSAQKPVETVSSLRTVKPGSGGQCVSLDYTHLKCVEGDKSLLANESFAVTEEAEALKLSVDSNGRQVYEIKYDDPNPVTLQSITAALIAARGDVLAVALLTYIESKIYSFMIWMSDGGIKADGSVQDYSFSVFGQTFPIKYSVDCTGDKTSFHIAVADEGFKTIVKVLEDGVYEIESRHISDDGKKVVFEKGYCIPMTIEKPEPAQSEVAPNSETKDAVSEDVTEEDGGGIMGWIFGE